MYCAVCVRACVLVCVGEGLMLQLITAVDCLENYECILF